MSDMPGIPYDDSAHTYITQSSQYDNEANSTEKESSIDNYPNFGIPIEIASSAPAEAMKIFDQSSKMKIYQKHKISSSSKSSSHGSSLKSDAHVILDLNDNDEKLKREIENNERVKRLKEKEKKLQEEKLKQLEENDDKIDTRLYQLQQQQLQKIVAAHEANRAKSQKVAQQRLLRENLKMRSAESAMRKMENAERLRAEAQKIQQEKAMQKAAEMWLKKHIAQQTMLQMERRKQRQLQLMMQKEQETAARVEKMRMEKELKERKRRAVLKKYYGGQPRKGTF
ncbi:hypothetical protein TRFO_32397 [Tritrichomonas foetus]|uniref:Uncharacterized protein n=1 Tax=Tritrichomonas foetus TaxID=1144522 RepID=A0A1J4JUA5_9EUKA|nr:hypothetical protein TRFO_32397 [Tritrichomonas foetus]|eukprot:OHT00837.1 hypothetical protein TRFO_32397 [Tritrichomonas foetus]